MILERKVRACGRFFVAGWSVLMLGSISSPVQAQTEAGDWYVSWGYNRSMYAASDVHMWGEGPTGEAFDVTFNDALASDMPERFQAKVYFHPGLFTIPQYNARVGRKISEHWWLSAGVDHMKYKLRDQWMEVSGYAAGTDVDATAAIGELVQWTNDSLYWGPGFNFEHSDGMNFVRFSLEREWSLWQAPNHQLGLVGFTAVGAGLVVCSTDFNWADRHKKNSQHISGLGFGFHAGLRAHVHRRFFIQATAHAGGITLPWIRIQGPTNAGAEQRIGYFEGAFSIGYLIGGEHRNPKKNCDTCPRW
jgi:hypothetical protein